jgi:type IV secretory pathway VirB10-like protein
VQGGFPFRESLLDTNKILHCQFPLLTGLLDGARVIDQMHFRVRAFEQHVTFPRLFIFGVEKDPASHTLELSESRNLKRKPLVGNECTMSGVYGLYARREQQEVAETRNEQKHPESARHIGDQLVRELAPPGIANPAPVFSGRTGVDRGQANGGAQADTSGALQPPGLVYRDDDKEGRSEGRGTGDGSHSSTGGSSELSAEEKLRLAAFRQEQEAFAAPTAVHGSSSLSVSQASPPLNDLQQLGSLESLLVAGEAPGITDDSANGVVPVSGRPQARSDYDVQNEQERKQLFLEQTRGRGVNNYLKSTRTPALGKYEVKMGWDIPAILEQGINSDLPGEVKALVRSNVYDTATGKYLLIPQGSRMVGVYDSQISYGQNRLQVIWSRIIYPDGSSINLDEMMGQDIQGMAGFHDQVDNHYKRLVGLALLTSVFAAGIELSQRSNTSLLTNPTVGQTASSAVGQQLGELGTEVTRKNLSIQPTIKIPVGYRFNVRVNRDILFEAPYTAAEQ